MGRNERTYTDSDGKYLFPDLPAGMYLVDVLDGTDGTANTLPNTGLTQTTITTNVIASPTDADTVTDDGDLGNKDHTTGSGYAITLDEGEENLTADFGYNYNPTVEVNDPTDMSNMVAEVAAYGDRVWIDSNGDGTQDPNEIGVSGVTVSLTGAGTDGVFGTGDDVTATTTTDENGYYLFDDLVPGAYVTALTSDAGASHDILNDSDPTMTTSDYDQTGDPDHFGVSEDDNLDDTVEDDNQQTKPVVLGPGDVYLNSDYGFQPTPANMVLGSIGNTVWFDADADGNGPDDTALNTPGNTDTNNGLGTDDDSETPIEGVSVALIDDVNGDGIWDADGVDNMLGTADEEEIIATDVTDENGQYLFEDLPLDKNGSDSDYIVWVNDTDNVLDGLRPTYDGDDTALNTTDPKATGAGDDADMVLGMSDVSISSGTPDDSGQDFGYTPKDHDAGDGFIGDFVWFDTDGDDTGGQPDAETDGDAGIEGVLVYLYDLGADGLIGGGDDVLIDSTLTDESGFYGFGDLPVDDGEGDMDAEYQVVIAPSNFDPMGVLEDLETTYEPGGGDQDDNQGGVVVLSSGTPVDLDQDFGYTGDDANTLGSIGSTIWEDTDNDGLYEPFGTDGTDNTADDEDPIEGVTVNLIRDLNGNGELDPGEPVISSDTTDMNGDYLFDNLPMDDYIVDVTDENGVLAGYFSSPVPTTDVTTNASAGTADDKTAGSNGGGDQSKPDAFAVTIDGTIPNNLNVDFGYYKEPAAVGNYVWLDTNGDGQQDAGESGIENVEVQMMIEYPDGTMVTLTTTTDADGFYEFPNLLLDEDYRTGAGTGTNGEDPTSVSTSTNIPKYVIKVDETQAAIQGAGLVPTLIDDTNNGITDEDDSDAFTGVVAIPVEGSEDTDLFKTDAGLATANDEEVEASYDFGATPVSYDLATMLTISPNETDSQFDINDPVLFSFMVFNQGTGAVSDITITNYLPSALTTPADGTSGISSIVVTDENGGTRTVSATVTKVGNDYRVDFGTTEAEWLLPGDKIAFDVEYTVNAGDATDTSGDPIINAIEISSFDNDDNPGNTPPTDTDSTPDGTDNDNVGENPRDNGNDNVIDNTNGDEDDHDYAEITAVNALPVELLSFKATAQQSSILLDWATASETNNHYFDLERSEDGKTFKAIARIEGQGTTIETTLYDYTDTEVISNVVYYYRLRQVDFDGTYDYSDLVTAMIEGEDKGLSLYPSPIGAAELLNVRLFTNDKRISLKLKDMEGRTVQVFQLDATKGWNNFQLDVDFLPAGTYLLQLEDGQIARFVKAKE